jgi:hypothetical protein
MRKPKVVLNNWSVVMHGNPTPYTCPETIRSCLAGDVVGHPSFDDGHYVTTSPIVSHVWRDPLGVSRIRDGMIIETANTLYMLEGVCPKYKAWCDANSYSVTT